MTVLAVVVLAGCPFLGPKDGKDSEDSAADGETGKVEPDPKPEPVAAGTSGETGAEVCEDELARVKAELAACQAK